MNNDRKNREESRFAEMLGAIDSPMPAPDEDFIERLKAESTRAFLAAEAEQPELKRKRTMMIFKRFSIAAAACLVLGAAVLIAFLTIADGGATIAWADVQEYIRNAQTCTFTVVMVQKGTPGIKVKVSIMEPGLIREELEEPEKVSAIMDLPAGKVLVLSHDEKKAVRVDLTALPEHLLKQNKSKNLLALIKRAVEKLEIELGEKEIDGRTVKGYRVEDHGDVTSLWVDAKTGVPVEVEFAMFGTEMKLVMSDLEFNKELDKNLFSMEVPEGYEMMKQTMTLTVGTAEDVVELLRTWTKAMGGTLPDSLTPTVFVKDCGKLDKEMSDEDSMKLGGYAARTFILLQMNKTTHYAGKGVKLGDAKTAIFWYKPKDAEMYKVIYGDLRIEDIAPENLSKLPEEAKVAK